MAEFLFRVELDQAVQELVLYLMRSCDIHHSCEAAVGQFLKSFLDLRIELAVINVVFGLIILIPVEFLFVLSILFFRYFRFLVFGFFLLIGSPLVYFSVVCVLVDRSVIHACEDVLFFSFLSLLLFLFIDPVRADHLHHRAVMYIYKSRKHVSLFQIDDFGIVIYDAVHLIIVSHRHDLAVRYGNSLSPWKPRIHRIYMSVIKDLVGTSRLFLKKAKSHVLPPKKF